MVVKNVPMELYREAHCIIANEPFLSDTAIQDAMTLFNARRADNLPVIPTGLLHPDIDTAINREALDMLFLRPLKIEELAIVMGPRRGGYKSDITGYVSSRLKERGCFVDTHFGTDFPCNCEQVDETLNPQTPESGENHE